MVVRWWMIGLVALTLSADAMRCPAGIRSHTDYLEWTVLRSRIHPFHPGQVIPRIEFRVNFLHSFDLKSQLSSISDASDRSLNINSQLRYATQTRLPHYYHTHLILWHAPSHSFRRHGVRVAGGVEILHAEDARHILHWTLDN